MRRGVLNAGAFLALSQTAVACYGLPSDYYDDDAVGLGPDAVGFEDVTGVSDDPVVGEEPDAVVVTALDEQGEALRLDAVHLTKAATGEVHYATRTSARDGLGMLGAYDAFGPLPEPVREIVACDTRAFTHGVLQPRTGQDEARLGFDVPIEAGDVVTVYVLARCEDAEQTVLPPAQLSVALTRFDDPQTDEVLFRGAGGPVVRVVVNR